MEALRGDGDGDVTLHLGLRAHLLQLRLLGGQLLPLLVRRLRHVGDQVPVFNVVAPRLLISEFIHKKITNEVLFEVKTKKLDFHYVCV